MAKVGAGASINRTRATGQQTDTPFNATPLSQDFSELLRGISPDIFRQLGNAQDLGNAFSGIAPTAQQATEAASNPLSNPLLNAPTLGSLNAPDAINAPTLNSLPGAPTLGSTPNAPTLGATPNTPNMNFGVDQGLAGLLRSLGGGQQQNNGFQNQDLLSQIQRSLGGNTSAPGASGLDFGSRIQQLLGGGGNQGLNQAFQGLSQQFNQPNLGQVGNVSVGGAGNLSATQNPLALQLGGAGQVSAPNANIQTGNINPQDSAYYQSLADVLGRQQDRNIADMRARFTGTGNSRGSAAMQAEALMRAEQTPQLAAALGGARQSEFANLLGQRDLAQRGTLQAREQDLSTMLSNVTNSLAGQNQANQALLGQRGQDVDAGIANLNAILTARGQDITQGTANQSANIATRGQDLDAALQTNLTNLNRLQGLGSLGLQQGGQDNQQLSTLLQGFLGQRGQDLTNQQQNIGNQLNQGNALTSLYNTLGNLGLSGQQLNQQGQQFGQNLQSQNLQSLLSAGLTSQGQQSDYLSNIFGTQAGANSQLNNTLASIFGTQAGAQSNQNNTLANIFGTQMQGAGQQNSTLAQMFGQQLGHQADIFGTQGGMQNNLNNTLANLFNTQQGAALTNQGQTYQNQQFNAGQQQQNSQFNAGQQNDLTQLLSQLQFQGNQNQIQNQLQGLMALFGGGIDLSKLGIGNNRTSSSTQTNMEGRVGLSFGGS